MGTLQKVTVGQPFSMGADTYNAFIDAAIKTKKNQTLGESNTTSDRKYNTILLSNSTGTDYDRFDVVGLGDPVITPTENLTAFQTSVTLNLVAPDEEVHTGKWAILLEPIADGRYGSAIRSGITPAVITVPTGFDHYEFVDLVVDTLTCLPTGSAKILWKEAGTGTAINCIIDLSYQKESQNACLNISGAAIPGYGVCEISGIDSKGRRKVVKPTEDNITEIMLAPPQGVPIGANFEGLPPFDNDAAVTGTITLGDEIGATSGDWTMTTGKTGFKSNGAVGGRARIRPFRGSGSNCQITSIPGTSSINVATYEGSVIWGGFTSFSEPIGEAFTNTDIDILFHNTPSFDAVTATGVYFSYSPGYNYNAFIYIEIADESGVEILSNQVGFTSSSSFTDGVNRGYTLRLSAMYIGGLIPSGVKATQYRIGFGESSGDTKSISVSSMVDRMTVTLR